MTSISPALVSQIYNRSGASGSTGVSSSAPAGHESSAADAPVGFIDDIVEVSSQARRNALSDGASSRGDDAKRSTAPGHPERSAAAAEQTVVRELQSRDREVRTHEQAHLAAAGAYARGGASFVYQKGPDGRMYAVGGEVGIDVGRAATPEETIVKMQTVRRAALAPAEPSAADRRIAAQASIRLAEAQRELQAAASHEQDTAADGSAGDGSVSSSPQAAPIPAAEGAPDNRRLLIIAAYQAVTELFSPRPG
ncbi:putative metalloprotease CJM1_0395 family protein [Desulfofustis glycolicus]|uniref:SprA-related family protein n=1 Tax=Desulfofustis glycolicus DSM 9705 TaxID=1121409 RepID=A0A1M5U4G8_9BACT|nr:putative metalloprotease CJM1_0395 family protein [Desulfofustis glycolicus]MCB2214660.1 hypothetical protein [Desulfobulbaceae bacterium]SHH57838.1 SprA-related family protein [Desulfofustis glycolicus DSM 9705]